MEQPSYTLERLVEAAHQNRCVREYRAANDWWSACWSEESIARKPNARVEFEHAIVFATLSEAISLRRSKSGWGSLLQIEPLAPDDYLHPTRIVYQLKPSSKILQRWQFRDTFKTILGKDRGLVNGAMESSKKEFLRGVDDRQRRILCSRLELRPEEFWRAVRRGDSFGPNGIHKFLERLRERTEGYELDFPAFDTNLVTGGQDQS